MKTCRRAYALIEIMVMIAAVTLLMALSVHPIRAALFEIPRMDRNYQGWIRTMDMLEALRRDVETASAIRFTVQSDPNSYTLSLETEPGQVDYEFTDERVIRRFTGAGSTMHEAVEWDLPDNGLRVNAWESGSGIYAVEIATWIQHRASGRVRRNFKQTHVFFRKAP